MAWTFHSFMSSLQRCRSWSCSPDVRRRAKNGYNLQFSLTRPPEEKIKSCLCSSQWIVVFFFLGRSIAFLERRQIDRWMRRTSQSGPVSPRGKTEGGPCTKDKRPSQLDFASPCVQNLRPLKTGGPVPAHRLHPHGLGPAWTCRSTASVFK